MELYKLVPLEVYASGMEASHHKPLSEQLSELPKVTQRKAKRLFDILSEAGVEWDDFGKVTSSNDGLQVGVDILPLVLYTLKGNKRPETYGNFAFFLGSIKLPPGLASQKASVEIKKSKKYAQKKA